MTNRSTRIVFADFINIVLSGAEKNVWYSDEGFATIEQYAERSYEYLKSHYQGKREALGGQGASDSGN